MRKKNFIRRKILERDKKVRVNRLSFPPEIEKSCIEVKIKETDVLFGSALLHALKYINEDKELNSELNNIQIKTVLS